MVTWDEKKRKRVIKDHGIDIAKIGEVFDDPFAIDFEDVEHSLDENRRGIIGKTVTFGLVFAVLRYARGRDPLHNRSSSRAMDGANV